MSNLAEYLAKIRRFRGLSREAYCIDITDKLPEDAKKPAVSTLTNYLAEFENDMRGLSDALLGREPYATVFLTYVAVLRLSEKEKEELSWLISLQFPPKNFMERFSGASCNDDQYSHPALTPGEMLDKLPDSRNKEQLAKRIRHLYRLYGRKNENT